MPPLWQYAAVRSTAGFMALCAPLNNAMKSGPPAKSTTQKGLFAHTEAVRRIA